MSNKAKQNSPLVQSVLAIDNYLTELERVGTKINSTNMSGDIDIDFVQKLMARFTECGQGITEEVSKFSTHLQDAQSRADTVTQGVARQAELFNVRRKELSQKLDEFRVLGEKVSGLNTSISEIRNDRTQLTANLPSIESQLDSLIEELQALRQSAHDSHMRAIEKNAESLTQTLQTVRKKLQNLR